MSRYHVLYRCGFISGAHDRFQDRNQVRADGKRRMFRWALIVQLMLGLLIGPNGCCCAAGTISRWLSPNASLESAATSCCTQSTVHKPAPRSCCASRASKNTTDSTDLASTQRTASTHGTAAGESRKAATCCGMDDGSWCACKAALRPSIHRSASEHDARLDLRWSLDTPSMDVVLPVASIQPELSVASGCHPPRAISGKSFSILFQRWNC